MGSITTEEAADATVVHLSGEIDGALRDEASSALSVSLQRRLPVLLDASGVTFIDSTGLAFLIQCGTAVMTQGVAVRYPEPPSQVEDLMQMVGLDGLFARDGDGRPGAAARP